MESSDPRPGYCRPGGEGWKGSKDLLSKGRALAFRWPCCCWVVQSCLTLWDPMDCIPPGSSVNAIPQARILKWVAISFSRDLPHPGIQPMSPAWHVDSLPLSHMALLLSNFRQSVHLTSLSSLVSPLIFLLLLCPRVRFLPICAMGSQRRLFF